jgi:hypothetical protein
MTSPVFGSYVYTSNAPDGVVCGRIGQFAMVSQLADEYTVQWSAIGDITDWPTPLTDDARSKQAGSETLSSEFGKITGISGTEFFGYVFQQSAVTKFTYVGGDVVFRIDVIDATVGCVDYNRFARVGNAVYFESEFGYYKIIDNQIIPIGLGKVDDTYKPVNELTDDQKNVADNVGMSTIFFEGHNLAYNYETDQWTSVAALDGKVYFPLINSAGVIGQITFSGQSVDIQDSLGGADQAAKFITTEANMVTGGRAIAQATRVLSDGGTWTVRVGSRDNISDSISWSASSSVNSRSGMHDFRKEGRFHRAEYSCSDGFTTVIGADIDFTPAGYV